MDQKHKAMKRVKKSEDRISSLPDKVLSHILSYLTTKQSVRTSILSKRWKSLWSFVPILDLDDELMSFDDPVKEQAIRSSFVQFVNKFFNLHKEDCLQKLTLCCDEFDCYRINEWVISAMRCKVKELDLCVYIKNFKLYDPLFVYQDLVFLKLGELFSEEFVLKIPGEVLMPSLKKLYLYNIKFADEESCNKLLSGCPALEYLHMEGFAMENVETLQIIAPTLQFLLLDYYSDDVDSVVVDAPYLQVFRCVCPLAKRYIFKNPNSLIDAYIDGQVYNWDKSKTSCVGESACQLVNGIANAKIITFAGEIPKVLSSLDFTTLPLFNSLTKLVLQRDYFRPTLLPKVLANSPFLQDLVLHLVIDYVPSSEYEWHDPNQVPKCLLDSLKSVEIWGFHGQSKGSEIVKINVLKFVKYLISNGKVLGELSVGMSKEKHKELKTSKELLGFLLGK